LGDAVPQTPWGLTLSGIPDGQEKEGAGQNALPIRIFTCFGARVAPQRCPILRAGRKIITEWEKTVNKIYRPIQKNSTLFWMIFCLDNGVHHIFHLLHSTFDTVDIFIRHEIHKIMTNDIRKL